VIVVDASALVDLLLDLDPAEWVAERLRGTGYVHAPHLLDAEVAAAVRRHVIAGRLDDARGAIALADLRRLRARRYPHVRLLPRAWDLRRVLTIADALYVALAESLDATLVTTDGRLARAHDHRARIEAYPGPS
jgi:predicted nucleic acid-binding protein